MVGPVAFVASWVVAGVLRVDYDPINDAISRLAQIGAPHRWVVTTGIVAFGLGCLAFAPLLERPAALALITAGVGSLGVATFPCSPGCPGADAFTDQAHAVAAGVLYLALALAPVLSSRSPYSIASALLIAVALALHVAGVGPNGLLQRIGLTAADAWIVAAALDFDRLR